MTLDRYKFLCALLVLGEEFTVEDVVRFANLPKTTIATLLHRESRFIERVGSISTGRRGGQIAKYRVRPEQAGSLEREADRLQPNTVAATKRADSNLAATLIVAEDTIARLMASKSSDERAKMAEVAAFLISSAEQGVAGLDSGSENDAIRQRYAEIKQKWDAQLSSGPSGAGQPSSREPTRDRDGTSLWGASTVSPAKNEVVNRS